MVGRETFILGVYFTSNIDDPKPILDIFLTYGKVPMLNCASWYKNNYPLKSHNGAGSRGAVTPMILNLPTHRGGQL
jgi:hypothetical protein